MALRHFIAARAAPAARSFSSSWWKHVEMGPKDPILGVSEAFNACKAPTKLNLGVGAYRDDNGKPVVLPSVKTAAQRIVDQNLNNEYGPIGGTPSFALTCVKLSLGADSKVIANKNFATLQALSGTGSLRLAGQFLAKFSAGGKKPDVYVPNPTWRCASS